jgi:monoterpene epsilon-lactone hydrolase
MRIPLSLARALVFAMSRPLGPPLPVGLQRLWLEAVSTGGRLPKGTTVARVQLGGRPAERVAAAGVDERRAVLLLHGGAFVIGSPRTHRVLAGHLSASAGAPVYVLHYRRAPEHSFPAPVDDALAAYEELAAQGPAAVFGDSAGGCLALLLALRLRDAGTPPPALALVSPVTDLTLATSDGYAGVDAVVRRDWLRSGTRAFVGGADAVAMSPLAAPLAGLPPVRVQVAAAERLRAEGEDLAARLLAAGVEVELDVLPRVWHDVHLLAHLVPEGAAAVADLGRWLGERLADVDDRDARAS